MSAGLLTFVDLHVATHNYTHNHIPHSSSCCYISMPVPVPFFLHVSPPTPIPHTAQPAQAPVYHRLTPDPTPTCACQLKPQSLTDSPQTQPPHITTSSRHWAWGECARHWGLSRWRLYVGESAIPASSSSSIPQTHPRPNSRIHFQLDAYWWG